MRTTIWQRHADSHAENVRESVVAANGANSTRGKVDKYEFVQEGLPPRKEASKVATRAELDTCMSLKSSWIVC